MNIKTRRLAELRKGKSAWLTKDHSTPTERRWLDRLESVRPDMAPVWITNGDKNRDGFSTLITVLRRKRDGMDFGCYPANLAWVKREVLRLEKEARDEARRECENCIAAGI